MRVGLLDAVDVLLVAFGLYQLMRLLRGTRAAALLKGIAIVLVATAASRVLQLRTVGWLLDQASTVLFVALPVVFYPEVRRALEQLGRGNLLGRLGMGQEEGAAQVVEAIVQAATEMSASRTGALIVLEGQVALGEIAETGVPIDAKVSAPLLRSLFMNGGPLHDGAVILREGRIAAAGAVLPLTDRPMPHPSLGTRHRAAVGVSEQSDAATVVVSEETGAISLAVGGQLERHLDADSLRGKLMSFLRGTGRAQAGAGGWPWEGRVGR